MTENRLTPADALDAVVRALRRVVPDADPDTFDDGTVFRADLEMDSLDFLSFVEELSKATGVRIDEADYDALTTIGSSTDFLARAPQRPSR